MRIFSKFSIIFWQKMWNYLKKVCGKSGWFKESYDALTTSNEESINKNFISDC